MSSQQAKPMPFIPMSLAHILHRAALWLLWLMSEKVKEGGDL